MLGPIPPDKSWPAPLIELGIMTEIDRLALILKKILPHEASESRDMMLSVETANKSIAWFADVLDEARLPPALDKVLRRMVAAFRREQGPLPPDLVEELWRETIVCLLRDRLPVAATPEEYRARITALKERGWIGAYAGKIPRGWLPIAERAVRIAETCLPPADFAKVGTVCLRERFARLEWAIGGHNPKLNGASSFVATASSFVCMACGEHGTKDGGPTKGDRILTLCAEHRRLRRGNPEAFQQALYPEPSDGSPEAAE